MLDLPAGRAGLLTLAAAPMLLHMIKLPRPQAG
jgi:hypothetical protein